MDYYMPEIWATPAPPVCTAKWDEKSWYDYWVSTGMHVTEPTWSNISEFKEKYLSQKEFKLIMRENFEMIELIDPQFDVRVYFSNPARRCLRLPGQKVSTP